MALSQVAQPRQKDVLAYIGAFATHRERSEDEPRATHGRLDAA